MGSSRSRSPSRRSKIADLSPLPLLVLASQYHERDTELKTMIKAPINTRRDFGAPWLLNHRVDLHNELKRLATTEDGPGQPAIIRTKARVQSVDCEQGIVTLESGETVQGDLIVGADGIHSKVRTAVLGHHLIAQPSGHSAYRCLVSSRSRPPRFKRLLNASLSADSGGESCSRSYLQRPR